MRKKRRRLSALTGLSEGVILSIKSRALGTARRRHYSAERARRYEFGALWRAARGTHRRRRR